MMNSKNMIIMIVVFIFLIGIGVGIYFLQRPKNTVDTTIIKEIYTGMEKIIALLAESSPCDGITSLNQQIVDEKQQLDNNKTLLSDEQDNFKTSKAEATFRVQSTLKELWSQLLSDFKINYEAGDNTILFQRIVGLLNSGKWPVKNQTDSNSKVTIEETMTFVLELLSRLLSYEIKQVTRCDGYQKTYTEDIKKIIEDIKLENNRKDQVIQLENELAIAISQIPDIPTAAIVIDKIKKQLALLGSPN